MYLRSRAVVVAATVSLLFVLGGTSAAWADGSTPIGYDDNGANLPNLTSCPPMFYARTPVEDPDDCVKSLQNSLNAIAGFALDVDGRYGKYTELDVEKFQRAHNIPVTGDADSETLSLLDRVANSPAALSGENGDGEYEGPDPDPEGLGLNTKVFP